MKKLILTYPNQRWQKSDMNTVWDMNPATLLLLAAMVKDLVEIKIIDAQFHDMSQEEFRQKVQDIRPDYVGISVMTSEYQDIVDITARIVKEIDKDIVTIVGGVHVTTKYEYVMRNNDIDFGVIGEGEYVLRNLILYLNNKALFPIEGLVYREDGKIIAQNRVLVENLLELTWPDYSMIDMKPYFNKGARFGPNRPPKFPYVKMVTTRGCPFGCSFCQVDLISGKKVRARDPEDVVNELLFLKNTYGVKSVVFEDDNMLMADKGEFAKKLFSLMREKELNLEWVGIAFALFLLNDEILDLMRDSGCVGINVAIESGNERVLKKIVKKPIKNLTTVPPTIKKVKDRGMYCIANFIIGFPSERWDEIRQTISFAETCGADYVKFFVAVPLYGTKLHKIALEMGSLTSSGEFPITDWRYSQIRSDEWNEKDISILRVYEWDRINFSPERIGRVAQIWGIPIDELNKIRQKTRENLQQGF